MNYRNMLFFSFLMSTFSNVSLANDSCQCNCVYYSSYPIKAYLSKIDSIKTDLTKKYGSVTVIGSRYFQSASLLFIVKSSNVYKAFYYDLSTKKEKTLYGKYVQEMQAKILLHKDSIINIEKIPRTYIDHDFGFFISYPESNNVYEICYSRVLTVRDKKLGKMFFLYMDKFD